MAKSAPEELWQKHIVERLKAFRLSSQFRNLRKEGLAACGRTKRFTALEWATSPMKNRYASPTYMDWYKKCGEIGKKYGLAQWTVVCVCLISDYRPESGLVVESRYPVIRVVTEQTEPQFVKRLTYEAQLRGIHLIVRHGQTEFTQLLLDLVPPGSFGPPPLPPSMPPKTDAFYMRVETPVEYPISAAVRLQQATNKVGKDIMASLGYPISQRLRVSSLVSKADKLEINKRHLPNRGLYEIVSKTYKEGTAAEDERRRKTVKTQRHRMRKRLVEPYEN